MKKYFLSIAALVLAIGFSAFTLEENNKQQKNVELLHWFQVSGTLDPLDIVPRSNTVMYLGQSANPPTGSCGGTAYQCISGFTDEQVSGEELIDDNQYAETVGYKKDS